MNKRILIISQHFYPEIGSAGNRIKNIYYFLKENGHNVSVITTDPAYPNKKLYEEDYFWDDQTIEIDSPKINRIQVANRKYSRSIVNRLIFYLEVAIKLFFKVMKDKREYDIVYVTSPPIFIGIVGLFAKIKFKSRFLLDIRDLWPESLKGVGVFDNKLIIKFFSIIEKILYKKADYIIVNSMGFFNYISDKAKVPQDKIKYIPNSARENELTYTPRGSEGFKVIYTGNIGLAQDIDFFKRLARKLNENQINLTIIGYGLKSMELKSFIQKERLNNITIVPPVTRKECLEIISHHHIGVVSLNSSEVFETVLPGKVIDYMTCKIPIVASVSGYSKKIIEKYKVGLVSEKRDINEIYDQIQLLLRSPELRNEMSKNCENTIRENFLWEKNIEVLMQIIEESNNK